MFYPMLQENCVLKFEDSHQPLSWFTTFSKISKWPNQFRNVSGFAKFKLRNMSVDCILKIVLLRKNDGQLRMWQRSSRRRIRRDGMGRGVRLFHQVSASDAQSKNTYRGLGLKGQSKFSDFVLLRKNQHCLRGQSLRGQSWNKLSS